MRDPECIINTHTLPLCCVNTDRHEESHSSVAGGNEAEIGLEEDRSLKLN